MGGKSIVGRKRAKGHLKDMKIEIDLPEIRESQAGSERFSTKKLTVELACRLYEKNVITFGQGCEMSGLDYLSFQRELGSREIPRMTLESFELELAQNARRQ